MNVRTIGILSVAALCGLTATAVAQERAAEGRTTRTPAKADAGFCKVSELIGMEVRGTENQDLGEVQDLLIDRRTNEIEYLVLDTGVFADLDGKQPIVPWMIVDTHDGANAGTHYLSIPVTQERIKTAPTIMLGQTDLTRAPRFVADVDEFYSAELQARRVSRPDLDQTRENAAPRSTRETDRSTPERRKLNPNSNDADPNTLKPNATDKPNSAAAPKKPAKP